MAEDTLAASSSSVNLLCDAEAASGHSSIYAGAGALRLRIYVRNMRTVHTNIISRIIFHAIGVSCGVMMFKFSVTFLCVFGKANGGMVA